METETIAGAIIILHATAGGIALLAGGMAQIVGKGGRKHILSGRVFYYAMLTSAISALIVSVLPAHESPFLFAVGIFSAYFIISGYRALRLKRPSSSLATDKLISWMMIVTCVLMAVGPIVLYSKVNTILLVFSIVGLIFAIRDLVVYNDPKRTRKNWLSLHIAKIMSGYISAVTAFVVVNALIPGIWGWFTPGIVGGALITMWLEKLKRGTIKFTA